MSHCTVIRAEVSLPHPQPPPRHTEEKRERVLTGLMRWPERGQGWWKIAVSSSALCPIIIGYTPPGFDCDFPVTFERKKKTVPLMEFIDLVFTRMPSESCSRRLRDLLLFLRYVFRALINSLVVWFSTFETRLDTLARPSPHPFGLAWNPSDSNAPKQISLCHTG